MNNLLDISKDLKYKYGKEESILIIGEGSNKSIGVIEKYDSYRDVSLQHGPSQLTQAFKEASSLGAKNIYLLNLDMITSYVDISDILMQYNFTYIVPLGIKFSDIFVNKTTGKKSNFLNEYANTVAPYSESTFIFTDEHASLYEDIDHFLTNQNKKIRRCKELLTPNSKKENFVCTLNNLKDYQYSNVVLASMLCNTYMPDYPKAYIGEAIFDLDFFDVSEDLSFFKNNTHVNTSVENLSNLRNERDVYKNILIQRVIKYIKRNLDLSEYKAKLYTPRIKISVYNHVKDFLSDLNGKIIRGFEINDIQFKKIAPGVGILIIDISILPINHTDKVFITLEV